MDIATETDHYVLSDDHGADFEFTGVLLATTSAYVSGKDRWSEYDLYRTEGGNYIAHVLGCSDGDWERSSVQVIEEPDQIIIELSHPEMRCVDCKTTGRNYCTTCGRRQEFEPTGDRYVPDAVERLLVEANRHDPKITTRFVREIA